jgi:hypothetical protein
MNRKGILAYLLITFGITYAIEGGLILSGFRITAIPPLLGQYAILGVMWVPALATFVTARFITHEKLSSTGLHFGSWKPYVVTLVLVPLAFILIYAITWALDLTQPDWALKTFMSNMAAAGAPMPPGPPPPFVIPLIFVISLLPGPFFNSIFGFGEEWGWRGYLLPRLMPLGKAKAYLLVGLIWGLWHAPLVLIGFNYPNSPILGVVAMIALTTALGLYINDLSLRYNSAILAGWIHGVFNSQGYGIWRLVFPISNPLLGGFTGIIGIGVLLILGFVSMAVLKPAKSALKGQLLEP